MDKKQPVHFITEYTLNSFFDKVFKMVKFSWKNTLLMFLIVLPGLFIYTFFMKNFFVLIMEAVGNAETAYGGGIDSIFAPLIGRMIAAYIQLFAGIIIYGILYSFAHYSITLTVFNAARGMSYDFKEVASSVLNTKLLKIILNAVIKGLVFAGIYLAMIIVAVAVAVLLKKIIILAVLLNIVLVVGGVCLLIWLFNIWTFSAEAIVFEDASITGSLKKSSMLVRGNWWRVFGIILLIGLLLSLVLSMISSPITFSVIMPYYIEMLTETVSGSYDPQSIFKMYSKMFSMWPVFIISGSLSSVGYLLIMPVFRALFYIDLKVRKQELTDDAKNDQVRPNGGVNEPGSLSEGGDSPVQPE